jgi:hypothetical protein
VSKKINNAAGEEVDIKSKQDVIDVEATYGVYHWNYAGKKAKTDDVHWSKTGN